MAYRIRLIKFGLLKITMPQQDYQLLLSNNLPEEVEAMTLSKPR
jgi:hypothetical protein